MERVSALRIALYEELQSLPEVLRSDFPDLAVDFLATVFRDPPGKPPSVAAADEFLTGAPAPAFRLLPAPPDGGGSSDAALPAQLAAVQSMLEAAEEEAARIEATASTMPPDGWGDLGMPLQRGAPAPARQQQPASRPASPAAAAQPAAQLVQCKRCHKVLLACSAPEHQRQCAQQEQRADAGSQSDNPSSSEGVPAAAPSASRGSKRKRLAGAAAAAPGGGAAKHSRPSQGGRRAASMEASPSLGEVAQGAPRHRHERRSAPPPVLVPAAPALAKPASSAPPAATPPEPLSPTIKLTRDQRRQRTQHPPRLRRRFLSIHPGRDLEQPLLLNAVAAPAATAAFDPAAGAAAAAAALAAAPVVVPLPAPGGSQAADGALGLPGAAPAASGPEAASGLEAAQQAAAAPQAASAGGGWGAEQQAMLQWAMQPQAAAAQQAGAPTATHPPSQPQVPAPQQAKQEPQSAMQQQQQQQQQQASAQQTAQPQAQQQQQQQAKAQDSCRIFQSLTPEQHKALREQLARRKAAQQPAAQQPQVASTPAAPAPRPPGAPVHHPPPRPAVLSPQQVQQLYQQNAAALQQQQQQQVAGLGVLGAAARPHAPFPSGFFIAQPALHATAGAAAGVPGSLPMQLAHSATSGALPAAAGQALPGVFLAVPAGQPLPGALPTTQQAFPLQQPSMPQQAQQQQQGGAGGRPAAVPGVAVGIPLPQASAASTFGGAAAGFLSVLPAQLPLRPSLPVYPGLRPTAAAAGAATMGIQGPAVAGLPAGMVPVGAFQGQQQAALVQPAGAPQPSVQYVPAP